MIDLHIHSTASDGTFSPAEIVYKAKKIELTAISITDHDTTDGIEDFLKASEEKTISIIPGVEMAGLWNMRELHILGFWIDWKEQKLQSVLEYSRINRDIRNSNIINKLNNRGYLITYDELLDESRGEVIGRPHIASLLVRKKYFKCAQDVFSACLARGSECYVQRVIPEMKEVISAIHSAGGLAVWAHPLHRNKHDIRNTKSDIISLMELGLDGIEAYYSEYSIKQHNYLLKCAEELNLAVSGGTDYHGSNQPGIELGTGHGNLKIPDSVYTNLYNYYKKKHNPDSID
ncbi:MAG TPA: hypothetical protein DD381_03040 [Lentisphaeria bacterium]|nr:MAG: hypothetical protein A2X47_03210 [Lentisphaerae bacterium GWF2_38_69]HBM15309.1 hypothetical protein [Lentisphaeria bacterium]